MTTILWLRRDLRRHDHPALAAAAEGGPVVPVFVVEPALWKSCGPVRRGWLAAAIDAARTAYDGCLCLRVGRPAEVIPRLADEVHAAAVHVTRETTPWGRRRDLRVARCLDTRGVEWVETGTPYAVAPGAVLNQAGHPYQVFSPFYRAWRAHGWPEATTQPRALRLRQAPSQTTAERLIADAISDCPIQLPAAGEDAAARRWEEFLEDRLPTYERDRDRPDLTGTSQLSPDLKAGAIHPRRLLADVVEHPGGSAERFVTELCWREFYSDVLHHHPRSAWSDLRPALQRLTYDHPEDAIDAWRQGMTGYPLVDAGMRQLLATGWMHNRVRMLTASFLTVHQATNLPRPAPIRHEGSIRTTCATLPTAAHVDAGTSLIHAGHRRGRAVARMAASAPRLHLPGCPPHRLR